MRYETLTLEQYRELKKTYLAVHQPWSDEEAIKLTYAGEEVATAQFLPAMGSGGSPSPSGEEEIPTTLLLVVDAITFAEIDLTAAAYDTIGELIAALNAMNTISMGVIGTQGNTTNAVSTLNAQDDANKFQVGDIVTFYDVSAHALSTQEKTVASVGAADKKVTVTGTWETPPEAADILIAKAGTAASYNAGAKTLTLDAGDANRFVAGDVITFINESNDDLTPLRLITDTVSVVSVDAGGAILNLTEAFTGTPGADDLIVAVRASGGDGWTAELGDQFDESDLSNTMEVGDAAETIDDEGAWMPARVNPKIKLTMDTTEVYIERVLTSLLARSTYGSGTSTIQVLVDDVVVWQEAGGATTVEKIASFDKITVDPGSTVVVRLVNSVEMTAGYLSMNYSQKDAHPYTI